MNKTQGTGIFKDIHIVSLAGFLLMFTFFLLNHQMIFPDHWFPSHFVASTFTFLFCAWILSEFINSMWSRKNSQSNNKDKGTYRIVIVASYAVLIIAFMFRNFEIGVFSGSSQYIGLTVLISGILLREWSIWVLGKYFTVRIQVSDNAKLVTEGPYKYIRHPAYTGGFLTFAGIPLAIGTWSGALVAVIVSMIAYQYRIRIEEEALKEAFGSEYEEYKKRTWKLLPGF
jgi:protein-S-isoprenylcysteine O-methyltransferase Ste14